MLLKKAGHVFCALHLLHSNEKGGGVVENVCPGAWQAKIWPIKNVRMFFLNKCLIIWLPRPHRSTPTHVPPSGLVGWYLTVDFSLRTCVQSVATCNEPWQTGKEPRRPTANSSSRIWHKIKKRGKILQHSIYTKLRNRTKLRMGAVIICLVPIYALLHIKYEIQNQTK